MNTLYVENKKTTKNTIISYKTLNFIVLYVERLNSTYNTLTINVRH